VFDWLSGYGAVNTEIQAGIATAVAAGVNATYWDTAGWCEIPGADDSGDGIHPNAAGEWKIGTEILALLP